jgi:hypothetical protein
MLTLTQYFFCWKSSRIVLFGNKIRLLFLFYGLAERFNFQPAAFWVVYVDLFAFLPRCVLIAGLNLKKKQNRLICKK